MSEAVRNQLKIYLTPIGEYFDEPEVTDIFVYGHDKVFVKRRGCLQRVENRWERRDDLMIAASLIASNMGRKLDRNNPVLDARLPDGSRVNIIVDPSYEYGACISIRKFSFAAITIERMVADGSLSPAGVDILKRLVGQRKNILIAGSTGSGKTTLLNTLCTFIPGEEIVVSIEDSREIYLKNEFWAPLQSKYAFYRDDTTVSLRDLIKNSLRMCPRWILLGEIRGEEAIDLCRAFNTGHSGMSTIHSNSALDALYALENLILQHLDVRIEAVRNLISRAIQVIIYVNHFFDDVRRVVEIVELEGLSYAGSIPEYRVVPLFGFKTGKVENGRVQGEFFTFPVVRNR